jgi:DNA repair protein RecN (Recombination protein N)
METDEQDRLRMADLWRFQRSEIAAAELGDAEEDVKLEAEKRVLGNAERLYTAAMSAHESLYEGEVSAESLLGGALKQVEELARFEDRFVGAAGQIRAAMGIVEDVNAEVRGFAEGLQASPERVDEIEDRLMALDRLKRKYGRTLGEVIAFGAEAEARLAEVENRDAVLAELKGRLAADAGRYITAAEGMTTARAGAAVRLGTMAERQINELAMKVRFEVRVTARRDEAAWTAHGWDAVECMIATNAGEPLKALDEIASGGEMSRVMLALKVAVEEEASAGKRGRKTALPRTLVFDEIDIGIGGRAAEAVGQKLKRLSQGQQVLCITHLPQIAAFADQHFLIVKSERGGRTQTEVVRMDEVERVREVARMLSGAKLTDTSLRHAESLIEASR